MRRIQVDFRRADCKASCRLHKGACVPGGTHSQQSLQNVPGSRAQSALVLHIASYLNQAPFLVARGTYSYALNPSP